MAKMPDPRLDELFPPEPYPADRYSRLVILYSIQGRPDEHKKRLGMVYLNWLAAKYCNE